MLIRKLIALRSEPIITSVTNYGTTDISLRTKNISIIRSREETLIRYKNTYDIRITEKWAIPDEIKNVVLIGPSGSGKDTQGTFVQNMLKTPKKNMLSAGEILRRLIADPTPEKLERFKISRTLDIKDDPVISSDPRSKAAIKAAQNNEKNPFTGKTPFDWLVYAVDNGNLVPDVWTTRIFDHFFATSESLKHAGFILNGYPRTVPAAQNLMNIFAKNGISIDTVIHILTTDNDVMKRLLKRKRDDDTPEAIRARIKMYKKDVMPVITFFQKTLGNSAVIHIPYMEVMDFQNGEQLPEASINEVSKMIRNGLSRTIYSKQVTNRKSKSTVRDDAMQFALDDMDVSYTSSGLEIRTPKEELVLSRSRVPNTALKRFCMLGLPGSGMSTQSKELRKYMGLAPEHMIDIGKLLYNIRMSPENYQDMIRAMEIDNTHPVEEGHEVANARSFKKITSDPTHSFKGKTRWDWFCYCIDNALLIPTAWTTRLMTYIQEQHPEQLILDGYPRTEKAAKELLDLMTSKGRTIDKVFVIMSTIDEVSARLQDKMNVAHTGSSKIVDQKIENYYENMEDAIKYLQSKLGFENVIFVPNQFALNPVTGESMNTESISLTFSLIEQHVSIPRTEATIKDLSTPLFRNTKKKTPSAEQ